MPTPQNGQTQLVCLTILWGSRLKKGFFVAYIIYMHVYNVFMKFNQLYINK